MPTTQEHISQAVSNLPLHCIFCNSQSACYQIPEENRDSLSTVLCSLCNIKLQTGKETIHSAFFCFECHEELGRVQELYTTVQTLQAQLDQFKDKYQEKLLEFINSGTGCVEFKDNNGNNEEARVNFHIENSSTSISKNQNTYIVDIGDIIENSSHYEADDALHQLAGQDSGEDDVLEDGPDIAEDLSSGSDSDFDADVGVESKTRKLSSISERPEEGPSNLEAESSEDESDALDISPAFNPSGSSRPTLQSDADAKADKLLYNLLKEKYNLKKCYVKLQLKKKIIVQKRKYRRPEKDKEGQRRPSLPSQSFSCSFAGCKRKFSVKESAEDHFNIKHEEPIGLYSCKTCEKTFKKKDIFRGHLNLHEGIKPFACGACGETFHSSAELLQHTIARHRPPQYMCDQCGKQFRVYSSYSQHLKSHGKEAKFQCQFCEKKFKYPHSVVAHERTHSQQDQLKCKFCDVVIVSQTYFREHVKMHEGEFKIHCEVCNKGMYSKSQLGRHMVVHTDVKSFECGVCHRKFKELLTLKKHEKVVHSECKEKTICCSICGNMFVTKYSLRRHEQAMHSDKKPFSCHVCGHGFALNYYLISHMKTRHPTEPFKSSLRPGCSKF